MNISTSQIIKDWVPNDSKVIDFGCGDGSLLKDLINEKNACGYGVEIDLKKYRNVL
jgi:cyclopropane fatty-acyl-phospholipid synthase-like methyltransferase